MIQPSANEDEPDVNDGLKIVSYVAQDGDCRPRRQQGWRPVNVVNRQAWQEIEKAVAASQRDIAAGTVSCLHYYMTVYQMTPSLLAGYTGQWSLTIRLHLLPFIFRRLRSSTLQVYADLFQVTVDDLKNGILKAPAYDGRCNG